ncbi:MerR family transcriptional regulator [Tepidimonas taiwanensis]|uniref:MerR family transcriptional regulator n=1 Tax=Tepidimonas taiwanensis TaxID=307486 RepID=UPI0005B925C8|nr:MerR family transcriptional regulator [Tepidimonas taiwanensis]
MRIHTLAKRVGIDPDTVRFYEARGLLPQPRRLPNGYRDYDDADVQRLHFIRHCRALEMPLEEIQALLRVWEGTPSRHRDVHALIRAQQQRVRERLRALRALERQLQALLARCQHGPQQEPTGRCRVLDALAHDLCEASCGARHASPVSQSR